MMPLVSIITVSRNSGKFIEDNILSVQHQSYPHIEHIVVDGGSTDSTVDILRKHKNLRWISEPDEGVTDAFNKGIGMASGDILAFLNSDDVYYSPGAVRKAVDAMEANPEAGVIFGDCAFIDADGKVTGFFQGQGQRFNFSALLCSEFTIPLASAFIRHSAIKAIGGKLDTSLDFAADWELWIRTGLKFPIAYVAETFGSVRECPGAVQTTLRCATENPAKRRLVLDKIFHDSGLSPEIQALRRRAYAGTYRTEAALLVSIRYRKKAMGCIYTAIRLYPRYLLDRKPFFYFFKSVGSGKLIDWAAALKHKVLKQENYLKESETIKWWL